MRTVADAKVHGYGPRYRSKEGVLNRAWSASAEDAGVPAIVEILCDIRDVLKIISLRI